MPYLLTTANTGLPTEAQVERLAEMMQADGHDVAYTDDPHAEQEHDVHGSPVTCPVAEPDFKRYLALAAALGSSGPQG